MLLMVLVSTLVVIFSVNTQADVILGPEPVAGVMLPKTDLKSDIGLILSASGAPGFTTYRLSSSGYNANLTPAFSYFLKASAIYKLPLDRFGLEAEFIDRRSSFHNVPSVSSDQIDVQTSSYGFLVNYELTPFWVLGVGATFVNRLATRTTPQDVMSTVNAGGPTIMAQYGFFLSEIEKLSARLSMFFPNYYNELSSSSGFSQFVYNIRVQANYKREIKNDFSVGAGIWVEMDSSSFSGTGTRQTTDARETFWKFYLPLFIEVNL